MDGFSHASANSAPALNARTIGAQPSACTAYIRGRLPSSQPISSISANAFHIPTIPVPPPVGYKITSGSSHPNCSAISYPIVFLPSARYGSRSVDTSNSPNSAARSPEILPASVMNPSTSSKFAPLISTSMRFACGASLGINTYASIPAFAAYALIAPAALPAEGIVSRRIPSSFALDTAAPSPRALNDPVGFIPSSLICKSEQPISAPNRSA